MVDAQKEPQASPDPESEHSPDQSWVARIAAVLNALVSSPIMRWGFVVTAVALATWAIYAQRSEIGAAVLELSEEAVILAYLSALISVLAAGVMWWILVRDLGSALNFASAGRIFFIGQLGKYLPGSVWSIVSQAQMGRAVGVSVVRSMSATTLAFILGTISGLLLVTSSGAFISLTDVYDTSSLIWVLLPALVVAYPPLLAKVVNVLLVRFGREPLEKAPTLIGTGATLFAGLVSWLGSGLAVAILMTELGHGATVEQIVFSVVAYALAWMISLLVPLAPAGVGVREAALVMILSQLATASQAVSVALMTRVVLSLADLTMAGIFLLGARRWPHRFIAVAPGAVPLDESAPVQG